MLLPENDSCKSVFAPTSRTGSCRMPYLLAAIYFINYIVLWVFIMCFLSPLIVINDCYMDLVVLKVES